MTNDTQFWDGVAERYAAKPVTNLDSHQRKLAITKAQLSPGQRLLDVGCATGSWPLELAPRVAHVDGLDVSSEMIRIAEAKAARKGVDNVTFHVGTLDDPLPFDPASFDGVCAHYILHLVADRPTVLRRLFESLKPGGFFISTTMCVGDSWVPYRPLLAVMRWVGKAPHVWSLGKRQLVEEIEAAGFTGLESPDVGANAHSAFIIATKPTSTRDQ